MQLRRQGATLLQVLVLRLECISTVLSASHPLYVFTAPSDGIRSVLLSVSSALAAEAPALTMQVFSRAVEMIPKCPSHVTAARCIDSVAPWLGNLSTLGEGGQTADDTVVRGVIDVLLQWTQQFGQQHAQAISLLWTRLGRTRVAAFVFKQLIALVHTLADLRGVCLDAVHMITQEQPEATLKLMCEVASLQVTSCVTHHPSRVTHHTSCITHHASLAMRHASHAAHHTSLVAHAPASHTLSIGAKIPPTKFPLPASPFFHQSSPSAAQLTCARICTSSSSAASLHLTPPSPTFHITRAAASGKPRTPNPKP